MRVVKKNQMEAYFFGAVMKKISIIELTKCGETRMKKETDDIYSFSFFQRPMRGNS